MPKVEFKPPIDKLVLRSGKKIITKDNLTYQVYEKLISQNPAFADNFIVTEDAPVKDFAKKIGKSEDKV